MLPIWQDYLTSRKARGTCMLLTLPLVIIYLFTTNKIVSGLQNCTYIVTRVKSSLYYSTHSSQLEGLCWTKSSSKTLQNLPYFWHKKTYVVFFSFFISCNFIFSLMNALVYVKSMANFDAFRWNFSSSTITNPQIVRSVPVFNPKWRLFFIFLPNLCHIWWFFKVERTFGH